FREQEGVSPPDLGATMGPMARTPGRCLSGRRRPGPRLVRASTIGGGTSRPVGVVSAVGNGNAPPPMVHGRGATVFRRDGPSRAARPLGRGTLLVRGGAHLRAGSSLSLVVGGNHVARRSDLFLRDAERSPARTVRGLVYLHILGHPVGGRAVAHAGISRRL